VILLGWALALVAALFMQARFPFPLGARPDLVFLVVCLFAFRHGQAGALGFGALGGLALDLFSGGLVGPHVLAGGLAGYAAGWVSGLAFYRSRFQVAVLMVVVALGHGVLLKVVFSAFLPRGGPGMEAILRNTLMFGVLWLLFSGLWHSTEHRITRT